MSNLAERIRSARIAAGIAEPAELARRVGVKPAAVYQWESGATSSLKAETALALETALHVNVRWLVTGRGPRDVAATGRPGAIDRDLLRQAVIGVERIISSRGASASIPAKGRAEIVSALYDVLAEGFGIDRAESIVAGTLRALAESTDIT